MSLSLLPETTDLRKDARPLDRVSDFPAIPSGWAYLDTAATAQKPRPVIDAIQRGYAETYATVHRGVYQRSAEMTLAFEASRRRVADFIGAASPNEVAFVRGADSPVVPEEAMAEVEAANPHASVHVVPQAGHMVFWDNAQGADQVLSEALDAVDGA